MNTSNCTPRRRFDRRLASVALVACAVAGGASAQSPPIEPVQECAGPPFTVVLIDDVVTTPPWLADAARRFRVWTPAQALRQVLRDSKCVELLDSDPIFWAMPDTAQPELILRAAFSEVVEAKRNLGEKASSALGKYLGSYLGDHQPDSPLLHSIAVQVDVLCPRARQRIARLEARNTLAQQGAELTHESNNALVQSAFREAARGLPAALGKDALACKRPGKSLESAPAARSDGARSE